MKLDFSNNRIKIVKLKISLCDTLKLSYNELEEFILDENYKKILWS